MNDTIENLARKLVAPLRQYFLSYDYAFKGTTLVNDGGNIQADGTTRIGKHPTYSSSFSGFWRSGSDYALLSDGTNTYLNAAPGASIFLRNGNQTKASIDQNTNVWQTPTLLNGWVNLGGVYAPAGYVRDVSGIVHLRGAIKGGATAYGTTLFALPGGFRPTYELIFPVMSNGVLGECRVNSAGSVFFGTGSNAWFALDGISFAAF